MRKSFLVAIAVAGAMTIASCGGQKGNNKVEAGDAQEAAAGTDSAEIDTEASVVNWRGFKPGGEHYGTVKLVSGTVYSTDGNLTGGTFVIDMNSINATDIDETQGKGKLEEHLKSADFFATDKYPTATFTITKVEAAATDSTTHIISGNLALLDSVKNISFGATITKGDATAEAKTVKFTIDRTQWGVSYKSKTVLASLKDGFIDDNIELSLDIKTIDESTKVIEL